MLPQHYICRCTSWPSQFYFCPWRKTIDIQSFPTRTNQIVDAISVRPIESQLSCSFEMAQSERASVVYVIKILLQLFKLSSSVTRLTTRATNVTWHISSFIKLTKRRWLVCVLIFAVISTWHVSVLQIVVCSSYVDITLALLITLACRQACAGLTLVVFGTYSTCPTCVSYCGIAVAQFLCFGPQ